MLGCVHLDDGSPFPKSHKGPVQGDTWCPAGWSQRRVLLGDEMNTVHWGTCWPGVLFPRGQDDTFRTTHLTRYINASGSWVSSQPGR